MFLTRKTNMINKKVIEDPCSLLLNQRSFYSFFFNLCRTQFAQKYSNQNIFFSFFYNKTPAKDFLLTKNLVYFSHSHIPEIVYQ